MCSQLYLLVCEKREILTLLKVPGFVQILEKSGKSWTLKYKFSRSGKSWKMTLDMEKSGKVMESVTDDLEN